MSWRFKFGTYSRSFSLGLLLSLSQSLAVTPRSMAQATEKGGAVERSCTAGQINKLVESFSKVSQDQLAKCGELAIPHLVQILRVSQDWWSRRRAVEALGSIGGPDVTKALIGTLNTDQDTYVRGAAVRVLGKIGGPDVTKALIQTLNTDRSADVRSAAVEALGKIGGPDVTKVLIQTLNTDRSANVRSAAVGALGKIEGPDVLSTLISALHDSDQAVRYNAIVGLVNSPSEEAVQALNKNEEIVSKFIAWKLDQEWRQCCFALVYTAREHTTQGFAQRRPLACRLNWFAKIWSRCNW